MTNVLKKISTLLLSFALIVSIMPLFATEINAEDTKAFDVKINGVKVGAVTEKRLKDTDGSLTNVYPFPSGQGADWSYAVAKGVPYADILMESLGIDEFSAIPGAFINWLDENGTPIGEDNADLPVDLLESATTLFKLVDENGTDITGPFDGDTPLEAKAVAIDGAEQSIPIISTVSKKGYSYNDAMTAKSTFGPDTEGAVTIITPFVGGYLADEEETYLKKDGNVNTSVFNFLDKYAIEVGNSDYSMNVKLTAPKEVSMTFDYPEDLPKEPILGYDLPEEILEKLSAGATWESADETVAKIEDGKVVPVGIGVTSITATFPAANEGVIGTINVKVHGNKAFGVTVNGIEVGRVDRQRLLNSNDIFTNVYPLPSEQGADWSYVVAKGVPYAKIVKESLGIDDFSAISGANIYWLDGNRTPAGEENGDLPVDLLESATTIFKLVDENGEEITGPFDGDTPVEAKAVAIEGAASTQPIISTVSRRGYSYDEAIAAKESFGPETEGTENKAMPLVGGELSDESRNYLKKGGAVNTQSFNYLGKYAVDIKNSGYSMNINLAPKEYEMVFDSADADPKELASVVDYDLPLNIISKLVDGAIWESSDPAVAKVVDGKVVPVSTGIATITAKSYKAREEVFSTVNVKVKDSIQDAKVVLSTTSFTYNAKVQKPTIKTIGEKTLRMGTDYEAKWSNDSSKDAGSYTITITGKGAYEGTTKVTYKIVKASNPLKLKGLTRVVKYSKVKRKTQTLKVGKVIKVTKKGEGKLTYTKSSGNKKIKINKKNGKITIKKGLKKGTYKIKVKVKAAGNTNYNPITKTLKIKIKIR